MKRPKILLVDDVRLFLEIEKSFFRREDVDTITAEGAREALALLQSEGADLVILDLHMPDLDGDECCRRIKDDAGLKHIPVLLVTGSDHPEALERCRQSGCDAVITKPLTRENFLFTARQFLSGRPLPSPRAQVRLAVRYGIDADNILHHQSFNLGTGGLFLETPIALPIETLITLELSLPGSPSPLACKGRIAWVNAVGNKVKSDLPAGLGVQFLDLDSHDVARLQDFLLTMAPQPKTLARQPS